MNNVSKYFTLDGYDRKTQFWMIYELRPGAPSELRPKYADLRCRECSRVDILKALELGIEKVVRPPAGFPDIGWTNDNICVVSHRAKRAFTSVANLKAKFIKLPGAPGYFVLIPKQIYHPPPTTRRYQGDEPPRYGESFQIRKGRCKTCQRPREVTWIWDWYEIPERVPLAGVVVEMGRECPISFVINDAVRTALKAAKITGWRTYPITGCSIDPPDAKTPPDPSKFDFPIFDRTAWLERKRKQAAQKKARSAAKMRK